MFGDCPLLVLYYFLQSLDIGLQGLDASGLEKLDIPYVIQSPSHLIYCRGVGLFLVDQCNVLARQLPKLLLVLFKVLYQGMHSALQLDLALPF